ncbi:MAG: restriction endonuclease subunit S [Terriglobales bacterium]
MKTPIVQVGELALNHSGAFKIGPFGSSLKKTELVKSGIPVAGIENVLPNKFVKGFRRFITSRKFDELSDYEILPDDVLVTTMGTIGRAASAPPDLGRVIFDSHLFRMRVDTNRVFPRYLCYALNSDLVVSQLGRMARGAIMEGLNTTILRECSIPLPEMSEQRRTAGRLEQADRLAHTRRYALELTDTFLPAAFLELFGHGSFPRVALEELATDERNSFVNGPFGSDLLTSELRDSGVPVIYIRDISSGRYERTSCVFVTPAKAAELKFCNAKPGDVLVAKVGDPPGIAAIYPATEAEGVITQDVIRIRPNTELVSVFYLQGFLNSPLAHQEMTKIMVEGTRLRFSLGQFKEISVPVPPLPLQQKFAALVEQVERLRAVQREALRQAEHLFASLLDHAFSGYPRSKCPERKS